MIYDFCVIGGGIVGLATALKLLERRPAASLLLLEKESSVAKHQTGHNSGVIHAGIYYTPGSLKAQLCTVGSHATRDFCTQHAIPFDLCGKLIVATNPTELQRIDVLFARATANGLKLERIDGNELRRMEPNVTGVGALLSPETGIVDYKKVSQKMAEVLSAAGASILYDTKVDRIAEDGATVTIGASSNSWQARRLVVCAGLQSDRLARLAGAKTDFRIVPFRGEYFQLPASKNAIVRHLIYPAPDPELPFLGIHLTRMIDGSVTVGPNAVLGMSREGYPKLSFNPVDALDLVSYPGFWKLVVKNRRHASLELRNSLWKRGYLTECRKYCPSLTLEDLQPCEAGIRAQAVKSNGEAVEDFLFAETSRTLHVCNAPSPAATSAIPIGNMIAEKCLRM